MGVVLPLSNMVHGIGSALVLRGAGFNLQLFLQQAYKYTSWYTR